MTAASCYSSELECSETEQTSIAETLWLTVLSYFAMVNVNTLLTTLAKSGSQWSEGHRFTMLVQLHDDVAAKVRLRCGGRRRTNGIGALGQGDRGRRRHDDRSVGILKPYAHQRCNKSVG